MLPSTHAKPASCTSVKIVPNAQGAWGSMLIHVPSATGGGGGPGGGRGGPGGGKGGTGSPTSKSGKGTTCAR